ncbi:AtpZ/AtpI family protein [Pontimicrobium sp. IMCC45349]|uniref:AtpZ/AtpI family protein n=1 Tax=Pontimicrobium sp. IMCC45349 TaxID=3391574 RepID=UPI0039A37464
MATNKQNQKKNLLNKGARFTGAGLQMGLTIYLFNWFGAWLDNKFQKDFLETTLTLFAIFASMYLIIVQVKKLSK